MRVLLSSVGRRGYLAKYFKQALEMLARYGVQTAVPTMPPLSVIATIL